MGRALDFVDVNYTWSGNMMDHICKAYDITEQTADRFMRGVLQTHLDAYITNKKLDLAADMLVHNPPDPMKSVIDHVGWHKGWPDERERHKSFGASFVARYWTPWFKWARLGVTQEEHLQHKMPQVLRAYDKHRYKMLEKNHAHKTTWKEIAGKSDDEKRKIGLSPRELYREGIHSPRNWRTRQFITSPKTYLEPYFSRKKRRRDAV